MDQRRGKGGEFAESVTTDDVLGVIEQIEGPIATAADVAAALGCTRQTARRKLKQLQDRDIVASRLAGRTTVWWVAEGDEGETPAPASPLTAITGLLTDEEADRAEARQREWREDFEAEITGDHGHGH